MNTIPTSIENTNITYKKEKYSRFNMTNSVSIVANNNTSLSYDPGVFSPSSNSSSKSNMQAALHIRMHTANRNMPIGVFVGPEGGFTAEELETMNQHRKIAFVSLGENILRSETAAVNAISVIVAALQLETVH
mmetsp:Transcript_20982/g.21103  ORF Transcript_20982/g.21103 Transcript_20982/m.21103 type:complete len:133 (+) Transcript_20982:3-401(+)